jgi:CheY-like chemotaxis protein
MDHAQPPTRILVVEDAYAICALLAEFLSGLGYDVACATDTDAALEAVRLTPPAIVLLDINLPGERTGDQILPMLLDAGAVVIVVSGSIDSAMAARLIEAGAFDCLAKPFTLPRLQQAVAAAQASRTPRALAR